jgi:threonine 3-dehydrogenase
MIVVTDVSDQALESARRWADSRGYRNLITINVRSTSADEAKETVLRESDGGVDVVLEMSGAPTAVNFGLDIVRMGGIMSLLGLPAGHSLTINDYTRNVIFKGITLHGIIGRRMYSTWQRMLSLLQSGLDVEWIVQARYDSLSDFHEGIGRFDRHEALKVVFFPEGEEAALRRLK